MKDPKNETRIAAILARVSDGKTPHYSAYSIAADAETLCRIGRSLNRLAEFQCNSPHYGEREEKRFDRLAAKAESIAADYGYLCETSHDPRGACLRLCDENTINRGTGIACL